MIPVWPEDMEANGTVPENSGSIPRRHRHPDAVLSNPPDESPRTMPPTTKSDDQWKVGMLDDRGDLGGGYTWYS